MFVIFIGWNVFDVVSMLQTDSLSKRTWRTSVYIGLCLNKNFRALQKRINFRIIAKYIH